MSTWSTQRSRQQHGGAGRAPICEPFVSWAFRVLRRSVLDWRIRSRPSGGGFGSQPGHEPGIRRGPQHVSDLSAVVLDQAHAVDHYVVNEPVRARLRHDVVEPDIRTVFGSNHGAHERDTPARAHLFTDKANGRRPIPWQFASDDAEVSPQEAITEELDELVAFDHAERTPFGLEHTARRARDIEPESREVTDFVLRLTGVGGLAEHRRGLSEEVVELLAR